MLDKPSGLLSVPGRYYSDSALKRAQMKFTNAYAVHRLDMDTSGLLLIALRRKSEKELHRQFRERSVEKRYIAIVQGRPPKDEGIIDVPLARQRGNPPRSHVDHSAGKPAVTHYKVLCSTPVGTKLALFPKTGRSHQLRVHLASIGLPIVGDRFYGPDPTPASRLLLHAEFLSITHPYHNTPRSFQSPAPF